MLLRAGALRDLLDLASGHLRDEAVRRDAVSNTLHTNLTRAADLFREAGYQSWADRCAAELVLVPGDPPELRNGASAYIKAYREMLRFAVKGDPENAAEKITRELFRTGHARYAEIVEDIQLKRVDKPDRKPEWRCTMEAKLRHIER